MSTLTVRLPDDTAERLKSLARSRGLSVNKLVEEMSAQALAAWDTENRFRTLAAQADMQQALAILDRLDTDFKSDTTNLAKQ
jgi:predicted transcriptional regulator